jgi:hypothetical protein
MFTRPPGETVLMVGEPFQSTSHTRLASTMIRQWESGSPPSVHKERILNPFPDQKLGIIEQKSA